MRDTEARELADRLDEEADDLEHRSEKLEQRTEDVSREWAQKRSDPKVPGAPPEDDDDEGTTTRGGTTPTRTRTKTRTRTRTRTTSSRPVPGRLRLAPRSAQIPLAVDQHHAEQLGVFELLERDLVGELCH